MKVKLLSFAAIPLAFAASGQQTPDPAHRPAAAKALRPTAWSLAEAGQTVPPLKLDLSPSEAEGDEIVVYGKRIRRVNHRDAPNSALTLGPATLTGTTENGLSSFKGMTITAALPMPGIEGLDAVLNMSGGHDQVNSNTTAASASVVAGLKLKF